MTEKIDSLEPCYAVRQLYTGKLINCLASLNVGVTVFMLTLRWTMGMRNPYVYQKECRKYVNFMIFKDSSIHRNEIVYMNSSLIFLKAAKKLYP